MMSAARKGVPMQVEPTYPDSRGQWTLNKPKLTLRLRFLVLSDRSQNRSHIRGSAGTLAAACRSTEDGHSR
jgi:hypothetical protein